MSRIELAYLTDVWVTVDTETGKVERVEITLQAPGLRDDFPPLDANSRTEIARDNPEVQRAIEIADAEEWPAAEWYG